MKVNRCIHCIGVAIRFKEQKFCSKGSLDPTYQQLLQVLMYLLSNL